MEFNLPEELVALRNTVRDFCEAEVKPYARAWDETEKFPHAAVEKLGELGLLGMAVPEEYGGVGLSALGIATVIEEIARYDGSLALTVASHNGLCTNHIKNFGTEEQKRTWLPKLATGEALGAWGLSEPGSGSDAASLNTTAVRKGDTWVLNGSKMWITQGTVGGIYVVLASTDREKRQKGVTAFLVEPGTPGFETVPVLHKLGMRSSDTAELVFTDCVIPAANQVGELNQGFIDTLKILDRGRITIGALAVGLGRGALEEATAYAQDRKAFGQPIADFQAIRFMLADMATELDAARLLVQRAAWLCDQGQRFTTEASMGKLFASEAATKACNQAIQIHGGYGYTKEFPVERYLRDAKLCEIGEGTSEIQRVVISRNLLA
jgi:alkylation response protein AidB-like acyl-CoA dehydrogenase